MIRAVSYAVRVRAGTPTGGLRLPRDMPVIVEYSSFERGLELAKEWVENRLMCRFDPYPADVEPVILIVESPGVLEWKAVTKLNLKPRDTWWPPPR